MIEIKNKEGKVLYTASENCHDMQEAVEEAINNGVNIDGADLRNQILSNLTLISKTGWDITLYNIDFSGAHFFVTDFFRINFSGSNFSNAKFCYSKFHDVRFEECDFTYTDFTHSSFVNITQLLFDGRFKNTNFASCNFFNIEFQNIGKSASCTFSGAILNRTSFTGDFARSVFDSTDFYNNCYFNGTAPKKDIGIPLACPSEGSFIGWKKILSTFDGSGCYLVKLRIPEDAKRSSATTNKCRCDKAEVLEITEILTGEKVNSVVNTNISERPTVYKVGEMVYPDSFDENRNNECSHGIHFFIDKQSALNY